MKCRDGFAAILVLFAVLVLAVVGTILYVHYYYLPRMAARTSSEQSATTSTPTVSTVITTTSPNGAPATSSLSNSLYAGWSTYEDKTGGFSILQPPRYKVQPNVNFIGGGEAIGGADVYAISNPTTPLVTISYIPLGVQTPQSIWDSIVLEVSTLQKKLPLMRYSTGTAIIAGNFPAQVLFTSGQDNDDALYFFETHGTIYEIAVNYDAGGAQNIAANKQLASNIITTFKTISPSSAQPSSTSWRSYTDVQFGISFSYPPDYWVQTSLVVGNSQEVNILPTDESQIAAGNELLRISIAPENADTPQSEVARQISFLQGGGYTITSSTATVGGYPAQKFLVTRPYDNGALYIFGTGQYTFVIKAFYDNASSAPNSAATEAANKASADRIVAGLTVRGS